MKVCAEPGCPALQPEARCAEHRRQREQARGTRQQRGYDALHVKLRAEYQRRMDQGKEFNCWRCGRLVDPTNWDLGHDDTDRTTYRGPECITCNRGTATRRTN